jgi:hypothetical protein
MMIDREWAALDHSYEQLASKVQSHPTREQCEQAECLICGIRDCPKGEPLHYDKDGCPAEYERPPEPCSLLDRILTRFFQSSKDKNSSLHRWYLWRTSVFGIFVHRFNRSDEPESYHSHPWHGVSLIFGSYQEQCLGSESQKRTWMNLISADVPHRVDIERPVWTIFIHGPRLQRAHPMSKEVGWGFFDAEGNVTFWNPWRGPDK